MNLRKCVATVAFSALLATGVGAGAASAQAPRKPADRPDAAARTAKRCEKAPEAVARMRKHVQKVNERIATLTTAKAAAVAAGDTDRAQKLQRRIDRLAKHRVRTEAHIARVQAVCRLG